MLYSPRSAVNITSYKDRSTNQIAGNSLFSSEIILNILYLLFIDVPVAIAFAVFINSLFLFC